MRARLALASAVVLMAAAPQAQAQMFHLYLQCQGTVAAGLQSGKGPEVGVTARAAEAPMQVAGLGAEKNVTDANENIQARTRAVRSAAKKGDAHLELALRDNNMTAFVQRSNVLPAGERMKYTATQTHYTATYTPLANSRAYSDWRGSWLFSWYPPFQKMAAVRVSVDRQTGVLEGEIVGAGGDVLGLMDMQCEPKKEGEGPAPRF